MFHWHQLYSKNQGKCSLTNSKSIYFTTICHIGISYGKNRICCKGVFDVKSVISFSALSRPYGYRTPCVVRSLWNLFNGTPSWILSEASVQYPVTGQRTIFHTYMWLYSWKVYQFVQLSDMRHREVISQIIKMASNGLGQVLSTDNPRFIKWSCHDHLTTSEPFAHSSTLTLRELGAHCPRQLTRELVWLGFDR